MVTRKTLTKKQEEIIKRNGLFVVKARPGSGKTFAVAARLTRLLREWQHSHRGILVISFTNVAWQEIEKYLSEEFQVKTPLSYPHFLGTIDSFLNQYIFLPFGHLIMGCKKRPKLVGPPFNDWEPIGNGWYWPKTGAECNSNQCKLNDFTFGIDDSLTNVSSRGHLKNCDMQVKHCERYKKAFNSKGYATQADSRYFSMKVLQKSSQIAKAIVYRFPTLMMDEAQDTSEVEMRTVELLIENGLKEAMLIGDSEQAIFEWREAKPELLECKYEEWKDNSLTLDENWRSSQAICNFFNRISTFEKPPKAVNSEVQSFDVTPKIWGYTDDNYQEIIKKFLELCKNHGLGLNSQDIAILVRGVNLLKTIRSGRKTTMIIQPWKNDITAAVSESKFLFDRKNFRMAFRCLEKGICKKIENLNYCSSEDLEALVTQYGFTKWRKSIYKVFVELPKTDCSLGEWIDKATKSLKGGSLIKNGDLAIKGGRYKEIYAAMSFEDLFADDAKSASDDRRIGTVHSVKGETLEAVLLILRDMAGDHRKYTNMLNERLLDNEELRIVYVAITRPRRIVVLAIPKSEKSAWKSKFST